MWVAGINQGDHLTLRNIDKTMKSKKVIKQEIENRLSAADAEKVWKKAYMNLDRIYSAYRDVPEKVAVHTDSFIFPAVAIYKALKEFAPDEAYDVIKESMRQISEKRGRSYARMTKIPGFKRFFLGMWSPVSRKMFGEESGFKNVFYPCEKGEFRMDITQCPYHKYLTELGCPEINTLFCDNDIYTYGNLPGIKFTRTKTIGAGDECCDFKIELDKRS